MAVLLDNFNNIRKHIDNSAIRGELVQLRALTSEESNTLLESATVSDANERLIYIILKGGVNGFMQFMTALQNTSEEYPGHRDVLEDLKADLKLVQDHLHSDNKFSTTHKSAKGQHSKTVLNVLVYMPLSTYM